MHQLFLLNRQLISLNPVLFQLVIISNLKLCWTASEHASIHFGAPKVSLQIHDKRGHGKIWQTYQGENSKHFYTNLVQVSPSSKLEFTCQAPYLTKWTSSIIFSKTEFHSTYSRRLDTVPELPNKNKELLPTHTKTEYINTFYYEIPPEEEAEVGGFGFVRCESVSNSSLATVIYIHTQLFHVCKQNVDSQIFINSESALGRTRQKAMETLDLTDVDLKTNPRIVIPCRLYCFSQHTFPKPRLYMLSRDQSSKSTSRKLIAMGTEIESDDLRYDETTGFTLKYKGNSSYPASYLCTTPYDEIEYWIQRIESSLTTIYKENNEDESGMETGIMCVNIGRKIEPSSSQETLNAIKMINCNFPFLCDSMKQCFSGACHEKNVPMIRSDYRDILVFPFNHGIVRCDGGMDLSFTYHYTFLGLDKERHWLTDSFKGQNKKAIIDLKGMHSIYYLNDVVNFTCEISTFVLIANIKFAIMNTNGIQWASDQNILPMYKYNVQLATSSLTISIKITQNMTGIICMAPWFNLTEWIQTTERFAVLDVDKPKEEISNEKKQDLVTENEADSGFEWPLTMGITLASVVALISLIALIYFGIKYSIYRKEMRDLTFEEINEFQYGSMNGMSTKGAKISMLPFNKSCVLSPLEVTIDKNIVLEKDEFSIAYRGLFNGQPVSVKTTRSEADTSYVKALLSDLKVMSNIGTHKNIVEFLGAVIDHIQERYIQIVVELSPMGCLHSYLLQIDASPQHFQNLLLNDQVKFPSSSSGAKFHNKITTFNLIVWCKHIASGMEYLDFNKVINGDLSTKNILVFSNELVKIADYGLSRQLYAYSQYEKKQNSTLSWRWMALESLRFKEFSIKSDVWSFGVTIWEIFTLGQIPYREHDWTQDFETHLSAGIRLAKPNFATTNIYHLMLSCWNTVPEHRPKFAVIVSFFQELLQSIKGNS